jgi:hypothetical protein
VKPPHPTSVTLKKIANLFEERERSLISPIYPGIVYESFPAHTNSFYSVWIYTVLKVLSSEKYSVTGDENILPILYLG